MLGPDENTTETERRLERLEREMRRRQYDSGMVLRGRECVGGPPLNPPPGSRLHREPGDPTSLGDDRALIEHLAVRLDHLERRSGWLEGEILRWRMDGRRWRRVALGSVLVGGLSTALLLVRVAGSTSIRPADPPRASRAMP